MILADRTAQKVLGGKSVQRERRQLDARGRLHHVTHRLHAFLVSGDARQVAAFGPAPVAVHDDRDVLRELVRVQLAEEFSFLPVQPCGNCSAQNGPLVEINASTTS